MNDNLRKLLANNRKLLQMVATHDPALETSAGEWASLQASARRQVEHIDAELGAPYPRRSEEPA